jgi:hypothetical protein
MLRVGPERTHGIIAHIEDISLPYKYERVGVNSEREVVLINRFNWVLNPRSKWVLSPRGGGGRGSS